MTLGGMDDCPNPVHDGLDERTSVLFRSMNLAAH